MHNNLIIVKNNIQLFISSFITRNNYQGTMWGMDRYFNVSIMYELRNHENKKYARNFFAITLLFAFRNYLYTN